MAQLVHADCLTAMLAMEKESVDAIVTDPPYGLSFMGKHWDKGVPGPLFWVAALGVARPGSYMLAFGGTRTYHRLACAIEDAGWEIHDCLSWLYGSGFPKHRSKLKPAWEPIILARKPAPKATPLNIDDCRIGTDGTQRRGHAEMGYGGGNVAAEYETGSTTGRWPANVVLDEVAAQMLDEQTGDLGEGFFAGGGPRVNSVYGKDDRDRAPAGYGDTGGASRFFYCAKASREERDAGLHGFDVKDAQKLNPSRIARRRQEAGLGVGRNTHPTVKPVALMRWLVRLVTPPERTVLDPFMGSGTTGVAAVLEGRHFIGIEQDEESVRTATARIRHAELNHQPELL